MKLPYLEIFTPESVHHPDRAQSFLGLRKHGAFLFLNRGRFAANPAREEINRPNNQRHNRQRKQRQNPIELQHDDECADQRNYRRKDVGETFVVDRLNRLRIVCDAKTGIGRSPRVMEFEREPLQMRVQIGSQFQQRFEADLHEQIIRDPVDDSPCNLNYDKRKTEQGDPSAPITSRSRCWSQEIVHDDFERPWLEQIQPNAEERQKQTNYRFSPERLVIAKDAPVDGHANFGLRVPIRPKEAEFYCGTNPEIPRLRSE